MNLIFLTITIRLRLKSRTIWCAYHVGWSIGGTGCTATECHKAAVNVPLRPATTYTGHRCICINLTTTTE